MNRNYSSALAPGSTIGILGGGQLGRMLAISAARLGFKTYIFSPSADCPAAQTSAKTIEADYDDINAIRHFANNVDVLTYEFENVPSTSAIAAAATVDVFPPIIALDVAQDRLKEKEFISKKAGVPVAPFYKINNPFDAVRALRILGGKIVIKTRRMGYDGKGQKIVDSENDAKQAFLDLGEVPAIAEKFIPFEREISVIAARGRDGSIKAYPHIENEHRHHILHKSLCPTSGDGKEAQNQAIKVLEALDYVGILAVEFFQNKDGSLIVNEIAPRVHNSGHWTMDAGCTDQFEMHIRAITGWSLGSAEPLHKVEMTNLLGHDIDDWPNFATRPDLKLHLYGKKQAREGRKMGHVNRIIK